MMGKAHVIAAMLSMLLLLCEQDQNQQKLSGANAKTEAKNDGDSLSPEDADSLDKSVTSVNHEDFFNPDGTFKNKQ